MSNESIRPISSEDLGVSRKESVLSNGAKVVVFEKPGMPVYMRATFLGGSRFDPVGKDGTSHFLEHGLTAGTKQFPSKDKLSAHIEQIGGSLGASTGEEVMSINSSVGDPKDIRVGFEVLHEMVLSAQMDPITIEKERGTILKELAKKKSNPGEMIWDVYRRLFFQGTPLGRSILGSEESIKSITNNDLQTFYKDNFTSQRMALVVCGGTTLEEIKDIAEEQLLVQSGTRFEKGQNLSTNRQEPISIEAYQNIDQAVIAFGFRTAPRSHPDNATLDVIAEVLGGGRASSLNRRLRYESEGLIYGVNAWSFNYMDTGAWVVKASTSKDKAQQVITIITDEVKRVLNEGLTKEEVLFAQNKIVKSKRMDLQTSRSWVDLHASSELKSKTPETLYDYTKGIVEVTPEMTRQVAQRYFGDNNWYLGMCGSISKKDIVISV